MSSQSLARVLLASLAFACPPTSAGVYKWVDAEGKTHYSDKPPAGNDQPAQASLESVALRDAYGSVPVATRIPIRNTGAAPPAALGDFTLQLDAANSRNVTIGRAFFGRDCAQAVDMQWTAGKAALKEEVLGSVIAQRFDEAGWTLLGGAATGATTLDIRLVDIKIDACAARGSRAYVKLHWVLHGATGELFRGTSEGAFDGWSSGATSEASVARAIAQATDNVLAEREMADGLLGRYTGESVERAPVAAVVAADVKLAYGDGAGQFRARSRELLGTAVTVRTLKGHGSGVVIDGSAFVITNAHVVGREEHVTIVASDQSVAARVVRVDPVADVALLQFTGATLPAALVSRAELQPGDPLFVIGTPLDESLSHTVTQGILSSVREERGRTLYQTDAALNRGNSGGPVFDERGELVAISVSGLFTRDGAGVGVNYLIPIRSALAAVGLGGG